ncbi:hypothetical protein [Bartonella birtlesii]|uniref:hypothetical protein n=1 Tax=Bartonella birtlesii TaxID=111504 RepID=UPI000371B4A2|nr:hypothetical protein [Bartonella birtlesii]
MGIKSELIVAKVNINLKSVFMAIAEKKHRPASQILRDLIRAYVDNNRLCLLKRTFDS